MLDPGDFDYAGPGTEVKGGRSRAYGQAVAAQTTPLRKNALQQSVYRDRPSAAGRFDADLLGDGPGTQSPHGNPYP